jgi:hypothetical protein
MYTNYVQEFIDTCEALSWQASLSSSAVSAAEDVRSAVRAARTAASAKAAAAKASAAAKKTLDKLVQSSSSSSNNKDVLEAAIHAAQTRVEISKSHEIHATLISHETSTVKRKAALALAHDVCRWSVHRKREMLKLCIYTAKSQRLASRHWADSWRVLKEAVNGPLEGECGGSVLMESLFLPKKSDDSDDNNTADSLSSTSPSNSSKSSFHHQSYSSVDKEDLNRDHVITVLGLSSSVNFMAKDYNMYNLENNTTKLPEFLPEENVYMPPPAIHKPFYSEIFQPDISSFTKKGDKDTSNNTNESFNTSRLDHVFSANHGISHNDTNLFCELFDGPATTERDSEKGSQGSTQVSEDETCMIKLMLKKPQAIDFYRTELHESFCVNP